MRALVTGVSSGLGWYLTNKLIKSNEYRQIVGISRGYRHFYEDHPGKPSAMYLECCANLRFKPTRLISQYQPDIVFHLAGDGRNAGEASEVWHANVDTTLNLLECIKLLDKPVRFVHISSVQMDQYPLTLYGAAKLAAENIVRSYTQMYDNIIGSSVKLCAIAGAYNKRGLVRDVVRKLMNNDEVIELYGEYPGSCKPFVYSGQVADKLIDHAGADHYSFETTFSSRDNVSVVEVLSIAETLTSRKKDVLWNKDKVWRGDNQVVMGTGDILSKFYSASTAVEFAIKDILKYEYK